MVPFVAHETHPFDLGKDRLLTTARRQPLLVCKALAAGKHDLRKEGQLCVQDRYK